MTLENLLNNEDERILRFPIAKEKIFLSHAAVTALPQCAAEAMAQYAHSSSLDHQEFPEFIETMNRTRSLAANLIGAKASEIALLGPTSLGLSLFANGIDWRTGDEVLCYQDDYPANVYPWVELQRKGVKTKFLEPEEPGAITPELVESSIGPETRLVALASCHYLTGYRIDIDAIGKMLKDRGILFALDGIQTCGAFPTPVENVDFMSCDAHKWLLGPCAAGVFYVRRDLQDRLAPQAFGWNNVRCPDYIAQEQMTLRTDARRYEAGSFNILGIAGFNAALGLLLEVGIETIASDLAAKRAWLVDAIRAKGFEVIFPESESVGGITSCCREGKDLKALGEKLATENIIASVRADRSGRDYLRFSPHFYNTTDEFERAVALL